MLSTNSTSSIQKRRQLHRRQQSLEVPILATPIPVNPRRALQGKSAHRRGLSLDQSLSALTSPTGFRPLLPQDHQQPSQGTVSTTNTNIGQPSTVQHQLQDTQSHRPSQPGFHTSDLQSHSQHQLQLLGGTSSQPPSQPSQPTHLLPNPQQAAEELQKHIEWFKKTYGSSPNLDLPTTPTIQVSQLATEAQTPMAQSQQYHVYAQSQPQTPASHNYAQTVPNTPQNFTQCWPSPPPTNAKHARSQSFQFDIAPMHSSFDSAPLNREEHMGFMQQPLFADSYAGASEHNYASSGYSSSIADPSSPPRPHRTPMPTLFEEDSSTTPLAHFTHSAASLTENDILLQATEGASEDMAAYFLDMPHPMSPRQAMLDGLKIDASINETGVSHEEVLQYISEQDADDNKWTCLFPECGKKFGRKENIRSHVQTHLGDRQFKCNVCNKCFVRQHDLKRHAKIHSGERDCECPCGQSFARADALTRHRQRGMCSGALPGFEKKEGEAPKRGRPKKNRPGMEERTSKAQRARKFDAELTFAEASQASNASNLSSSSGGSDRSGPITPPDSSDFSSDTMLENFLEMDAQNFDFAQWGHDTPPTSPFTGTSPTKTVDSYAAPLSIDEQGISPAALQMSSSMGGETDLAPFDPEYQPPVDFRDYLSEWLHGG